MAVEAVEARKTAKKWNLLGNAKNPFSSVAAVVLVLAVVARLVVARLAVAVAVAVAPMDRPNCSRPRRQRQSSQACSFQAAQAVFLPSPLRYVHRLYGSPLEWTRGAQELRRSFAWALNLPCRQMLVQWWLQHYDCVQPTKCKKIQR
eukprot:SAG31_NODE_4425_length_3246_cov_1.445186_3_plen_147_part_00